MELQSELTEEQIRALGARLENTRYNIFVVAEEMFGPDVSIEDEVFEDLATVCRVFKCEVCERWLSTMDKAECSDELCVDCE